MSLDTGLIDCSVLFCYGPNVIEKYTKRNFAELWPYTQYIIGQDKKE
jgi:hypothetical protein